MIKKNKKPADFESEVEKLKRIFQNYGLNILDMTEEEFERLYKSYKESGKDINKDLRDSEKFSGKYDDDII